MFADKGGDAVVITVLSLLPLYRTSHTPMQGATALIGVSGWSAPRIEIAAPAPWSSRPR
jgi:hypothetical protein